MKYIKSILASLVVACSLTSCDPSDFGDINVNPNYPTEGYTYMQFKFAAKYVRYFAMMSNGFDPWNVLWTGYLAESVNNQYSAMNTTTEFATGSYYYYPIKTLNEIIEANQNEETKGTPAVLSFGSNENQIGACVTLRSFFYMSLSDIIGPIVYTDAIKGASDDNWTPKYDSQKDVYEGLDKELNAAYAMMNDASSLSKDDYLFDGDIKKWKKFNASLRMMLAIKLADVDPAAGKARFAKAYADGGMTKAADSFQYTFDTSAAAFMYSTSVNNGAANYVPNKVLVDLLKEYKDPRLFTYATIGDDAIKGKRPGQPNDFDAYFGTAFGLETNDAVVVAASKACSAATRYQDPTATYGLITAARTLLVEAEAALLGWIDADASALYEAGIRESFNYEASMDSKNAYFNAEMADDYIKAHPLPADKAQAMHEVVIQRFLAGFMTDAIETWSDWRRHNIPTLPMYKGQTDNGTMHYHYRMMFGANDINGNEDNVKAITQSDLGGNDSCDQRVWWDVKDNECPIGVYDWE
ncbi:MAG: SusD/RagB family nutrient-binding outer membrane lipoprotein [Bacteroidaceae bacterium]|nr:SusD/RagB family nutrient-binding outer membrane lipoprotein [Bacteroidaceae bacterium]